MKNQATSTDRLSEIQSLLESRNLFVTTLKDGRYIELIPIKAEQLALFYEALGLGHIEGSRKRAIIEYDGFGIYVFTNATEEEAPLFHERNMVSSRVNGKVTPSEDFDYAHAQVLCERHLYPDFASWIAEIDLQS
jgi:hypothetical protein